MTDKQVLIPLIRKLMPAALAEDILGVQPMAGPMGQVFSMSYDVTPTPKFVKIDNVPNLPDGWVALEANEEIQYWVQSNYPISEWSFTEPHYLIVSENVYVWMLMRWA